MEPLYWRLAADRHCIPLGAGSSGLIGKLCAGGAGSAALAADRGAFFCPDTRANPQQSLGNTYDTDIIVKSIF